MKILVVGQTPPPFHGQAVMIEETLKRRYKGVTLFHIRMSFSKKASEVGKFQLKKILHLIHIIGKIIAYRFIFNINIFYYPPAGPNKIPIYRDFVILLFAQLLFMKIIFHFHAAGVSKIYDELSPLLRPLYRICYFAPDVAISLSEYNPRDGVFLKARKEFIVPNGIADHYLDNHRNLSVKKDRCCLLYVGRIIESKGIKILIEACQTLKERGLDFKLTLVGQFESIEFRKEINRILLKYELQNNTEFTGVLTEAEKFGQYRSADIFCYPTYFESESFGTVLLEAMQFSLPIVASQWRGVCSVVRNGSSGFLVPKKDSHTFADKLELLMMDTDLRNKMGNKGREIYLKEYTLEKYHENMERVFLTLATER